MASKVSFTNNMIMAPRKRRVRKDAPAFLSKIGGAVASGAKNFAARMKAWGIMNNHVRNLQKLTSDLENAIGNQDVVATEILLKKISMSVQNANQGLRAVKNLK